LSAAWQHRRDRDRLRHAPDPLLIGATGGSGTRIVTRIAQHAGWFMGDNLNHALDSLDTADWVKHWIPPFLRDQHNPRDMASALDDALVLHRRGIARVDQPWGFKNPRGILLLPFYVDRFPDMRFIHVVRDGRDMAFSSNITQVLWYGDLILPDHLKNKPIPVRSMAMWELVNSQAHRLGRERLGHRYLLVRFEDLCANRRLEVARIFKFLQADTAHLDAAIAEIHQPTEAGRWREKQTALVEAVLAETGQALAEFGYAD
jgi:hypothetical protein